MTLQKAGEIIYEYIKVVPKAEDWDVQRAAQILRVNPRQLVQAIARAEKQALIATIWKSWLHSRVPIWIESRNGYHK